MAASEPKAAPASPEELVPVGGQDKPQQAPAQNWQYKQGLLAARGNLSSGGASGSLSIADQAPDWLWDLRMDTGVLNGNFGVNLSAAGGWSPTGNYGAFLKLSGEFSSKAWEHFQALLNLGWRPVDKLSFLMTLDYLQKRTEVESWDQAEYLSQYGIGLETAYQITPSISLSGQFMHYDTQGKKFGKVGEYEYTDDNNWYHYGHIFGGVRGGKYNEVGLGAEYAHPSGRLLFSLGVSQVWRTYEEMLGHAEKDEDNGAGSASLTLPNLMGSGLNFNAAYRQEFATDTRQSWQVGAYRMFGPVSLGVYYQELSNDLAATDRRLYASLSLPLGAAQPESNPRADKSQALADKKTEQVLADPNLIRQMAGLNPKNHGQNQRSKAAWLRNPVKGMGTPNLRVAQQVEQRIDQTKVDMDGMPEDSSVKGNVLTVGGFPGLSSIAKEGCLPESAVGAFSVGDGGTSVKVRLDKLPAPANVWASFKQSDGNYSLLYLSTEKGSIITKIGNKLYHLPDWLWMAWSERNYYSFEERLAIVQAIKRQRPTVTIVGPKSVFVNDSASYYVKVKYPEILRKMWDTWKRSRGRINDKPPWEVFWPEFYTWKDKISHTFYDAGWHKLTAEVDFKPIYSKVSAVKWVKAVERPKEEEEDKGGGPAPVNCNITGQFRLTSPGLDYFITFDGTGRILNIAGAPPSDPNPMAGGVWSNSTTMSGNTITGTMDSDNAGGDNYVHTFNLNCNGSTMSGTITVSINGGPPTVYNVNGAKL